MRRRPKARSVEQAKPTPTTGGKTIGKPIYENDAEHRFVFLGVRGILSLQTGSLIIQWDWFKGRSTENHASFSLPNFGIISEVPLLAFRRPGAGALQALQATPSPGSAPPRGQSAVQGATEAGPGH